MRHLKRPDLWFLLAIVAVTIAGAVLLARADATDAESRRLSYDRHYWQATFDSLSAACGVGMLTYDFHENYTPRGRWILTAIGVVGALLFLAAVTHAARRMQAADAQRRVPHPLLVVGFFLIVEVAALGVYVVAMRMSGSGGELPENLQHGVAALSSLGWASDSQQGVAAWPLALLAWIGAIGWPIWLLTIPALTRRFVHLRATLAILGAYVTFLLLAALLIATLETPRGTAPRPQSAPTLMSGEQFSARFVRGLVQTVSASAAGMPTEPLEERSVSDGTKVTLALLMLGGGLGGSATGGLQLPLLLWALGGAAAALGWLGARKPAPDVARWMHAGLACAVLLLLIVLVVAGGLLLLENATASAYQPPPTFADALLDATSVVAGGNLSSGLTDAVTGRNLVAGLGRASSVYQYGLGLLMIAMLAGRLLPLAILRRVADSN